MPPLRIDILTLFPDMFTGVLGSSILKRAADASAKKGEKQIFGSEAAVSYHLHDIRDHADNKHGKVDNSPYGGGPGMVMKCQPVWAAVKHAEAQDPRPATRILLTPQGKTLTQPMVEILAQKPRLLLIAGHYEGIDERVVEALAPMEEISIGDYVLSGGELAAMVLIDAVVRLLPGVLGDADSAHFESFSAGSGRLLDHPHYTRPPVWMDKPVPEVLIGGDHSKVAKWRAEQALNRTRARRPDLLPPEPAKPDPDARAPFDDPSPGA